MAQIVNGYINTVVRDFNRDILAGRGAAGRPESELIVRNWYIPNLEYLYFTLPCLIANILMIMGIMIPALSVAREREFGTFDQILVSPLSTFEIIVGKTAPSLLIGFLQATMMIAAAIWCLGSPMVGSWLMLYTGMTVFIASVIGVGLFISSLCKTQQQAILGAFVFAVPAVLISGYATPDREYAALAADAFAGEPGALDHGDRERGFPERHLLGDCMAKPLPALPHYGSDARRCGLVLLAQA